MDDPKRNILNAASVLFLEGGASALNVRAIASRAGISTIGIYSHFQGKQGILDALYIEGFQRVAKAMDVMTAGADPKQAVLKACRNYLDSAEQYEAHYRLIFDNAERGYEPSEAAKAVGAAAFKVLNDLVAHLLPASASKAKRHDAAMQVWSVVHGFVGLKHHAVAQLVDMRHWRARAMQVLEIVVDAIAEGRIA
ncbi:MAG: TetR/AcrR family transcriptional regulator [Pseudomarimonas sp.]